VGIRLRTLLVCSVDVLHGVMMGMQARLLMKLGSTSDTRRGIGILQCAECKALCPMEIEGSVAGG
jgi:hypothetical protein